MKKNYIFTTNSGERKEFVYPPNTKIYKVKFNIESRPQNICLKFKDKILTDYEYIDQVPENSIISIVQSNLKEYFFVIPIFQQIPGLTQEKDGCPLQLPGDLIDIKLLKRYLGQITGLPYKNIMLMDMNKNIPKDKDKVSDNKYYLIKQTDDDFPIFIDEYLVSVGKEETVESVCISMRSATNVFGKDKALMKRSKRKMNGKAKMKDTFEQFETASLVDKSSCLLI